MLVSELISLLRTFNPLTVVRIRYEEEVGYSEYTRGEEYTMVNLDKDAVFDSDESIVLAADMCEEV